MTATETKHTPGPWHAAGLLVWSADPASREAEQIAHALHDHTRGDILRMPHQDVAEANARLIAAAPALLAACEEAAVQLELSLPPGRECNISYQGLRDAIAQVRAAIAAARGPQ